MQIICSVTEPQPHLAYFLKCVRWTEKMAAAGIKGTQVNERWTPEVPVACVFTLCHCSATDNLATLVFIAAAEMEKQLCL